jgi:hypothetical protein
MNGISLSLLQVAPMIFLRQSPIFTVTYIVELKFQANRPDIQKSPLFQGGSGSGRLQDWGAVR